MLKLCGGVCFGIILMELSRNISEIFWWLFTCYGRILVKSKILGCFLWVLFLLMLLRVSLSSNLFNLLAVVE